ncbi:recombinase family protein [Marinobacter sp.]|uniref:recombinase family protein n=1 Tax=Marinobacter sp. TaxID=50741 RepID=UPI0035C7638C
MFVRAYLRASTEEQNAERALHQLDNFAIANNFRIASYYIENESGASLQRPELFRLLRECQKGDVLLVEQVDRLSRLSFEDWDKLKDEIKSRGVRVVALDLPTSWELLEVSEDLNSRIKDAFNSMMLDVLAAVARKDYEDRRRRQVQGIEKAKKAGKYRGRRENKERNRKIYDLLLKGLSWSEICELTGASRSTLSRIKKTYSVS